MKNDNEKSLRFVLRHYQKGRLNTKKALTKVKAMANVDIPKRHYWQTAAAAAIVLALVGGTFYLTRQEQTVLAADNLAKTYRLPDGTVVTLAPHSSIAYEGNNCRSVTLEGRAFFDIKHDDTQPFKIEDERYTIQDIGTKIAIDETGGDTKVAVLQGSISLAGAADKHKLLILRTGQGAEISAQHAEARLCDNVSTNLAAWATGELHFYNAPVNAVLKDLEQCYGVKFTASDTTKRLTGDFETSSMDTVISIIEKTLNTKISIKPQ